MPEYIPKARFPEELANQVLNTRAQRVNPWESLASVVSSLVGKKDAKIEAKKAKDEDEDLKFRVEAFKGLASGDLTLKDPNEPLDVKKIHSQVRPWTKEELAEKKKSQSVDIDSTPLPDEVRLFLNTKIKDPALQLKPGVLTGHAKVLSNAAGVDFKEAQQVKEMEAKSFQQKIDSYETLIKQIADKQTTDMATLDEDVRAGIDKTIAPMIERRDALVAEINKIKPGTIPVGEPKKGEKQPKSIIGVKKAVVNLVDSEAEKYPQIAELSKNRAANKDALQAIYSKIAKENAVNGAPNRELADSVFKRFGW